MKRFALLIVLVFVAVSASFAAEAITVSPGIIASPAPAPTICISGFKAGSFVWVDVPGFGSYNFDVSNRGLYCYAADYTINLDPGEYDVTSTVCRHIPGNIPDKCKNGPTATLTVN